MHSVITKSGLQFVQDLERENSLKDRVSCGISSEISQMKVLTQDPCNEGFEGTQSLERRDWGVILGVS